MAEELKDEQSCLVFGRGRNYASAMEAALKVRRGAVSAYCLIARAKHKALNSAWDGGGMDIRQQLTG